MLEHWHGICVQPSFLGFHRKMEPKCRSTALLLHNWEEIVDLWCTTLPTAEEDALEPLVEYVRIVNLLCETLILQFTPEKALCKPSHTISEQRSFHPTRPSSHPSSPSSRNTSPHRLSSTSSHRKRSQRYSRLSPLSSATSSYPHHNSSNQHGHSCGGR